MLCIVQGTQLNPLRSPEWDMLGYPTSSMGYDLEWEGSPKRKGVCVHD